MRIIQYQGGGLSLPSGYRDFRPAIFSFLQGLSNENTAQSKGVSFASDEKGAIGIFTKTMTDQVMKDTLPVDAQSLIDLSVNFDRYVDPSNPRRATAMYTKILQNLQQAHYEKTLYDEAVKQARTRGALAGPAISEDGTVWVKQGDKIGKKSVHSVSSKDRVLTVSEMAQLRAYNPQLAGDSSVIIAIDNATSMKAIQDYINDVISTIGSYSDNRKVFLSKQKMDLVEGLQAALNVQMDGIYKVTINSKDNMQQLQGFLKYLYNTLDTNQKNYLTVVARKNGMKTVDDKGNPIDPVFTLLLDLVQGKHEQSKTYEAEFQKDMSAAAQGLDIYKEYRDKPSGSEKGLDDTPMTPALLFYREMGSKESFTFQVEGVTLNTIGTVSTLHDSNGNPMGWSSLSQVATSQFSGLDVDQAHFGDYKVLNRDKIQVDGKKIVNMYLPVSVGVGNEVKPDFDLFRKATQLQKKTANLTDVDQINRIYQQEGLPAIFKKGPNGEKILTPQYARFAVMEAYADRKALPKVDAMGAEIKMKDTVQRVGDEYELEAAISRFKDINKDYTETKSGGFLGIGKDTDIFKGLVFIPIRNDILNWYTKPTAKNAERLEIAKNHTPEVASQRYQAPKLNISG